MGQTYELDGFTWVVQSEKPCTCCRNPTFRMSRRTPTSLIYERFPGTNGAHTFTSVYPHAPGRMFTLCHACFTREFDGDRKKVLAWDKARLARTRVAQPTSE